MQCRSLLLLVGAVRKDQVDKHQPAASALNNQEGLRLVVFFRFNTSQLQTRSSFEVTFQSFAPLSRSEKSLKICRPFLFRGILDILAVFGRNGCSQFYE